MSPPIAGAAVRSRADLLLRNHPTETPASPASASRFIPLTMISRLPVTRVDLIRRDVGAFDVSRSGGDGPSTTQQDRCPEDSQG